MSLGWMLGKGNKNCLYLWHVHVMLHRSADLNDYHSSIFNLYFKIKIMEQDLDILPWRFLPTYKEQYLWNVERIVLHWSLNCCLKFYMCIHEIGIVILQVILDLIVLKSIYIYVDSNHLLRTRIKIIAFKRGDWVVSLHTDRATVEAN